MVAVVVILVARASFIHPDAVVLKGEGFHTPRGSPLAKEQQPMAVVGTKQVQKVRSIATKR